MHLAARQSALDALLVYARPFWHESPFKTERPPWCEAHPGLEAALLALDDAGVAQLAADRPALAALCAEHVPELAELGALTALPPVPCSAPVLPGAHFGWQIPGRKQAQIQAFAAAAGPQQGPVVEWCAGKGHLGRLVAARAGVTVSSLERDAVLCAQGADLARRARVDNQTFHVEDVLQPAALAHLPGAAVLALHACGNLHRALCAAAEPRQLRALHLAPCCHDRGQLTTYAGRAGTCLQLEAEHLRLAVQDTVTASAREIRLREREMAWKLAFVAWRGSLGPGAYRPFKPVPDSWLKGDFAQFMARLAARESCRAPPAAQLDAWEARGHARARTVARLALARLAFGRALEIWYVADLALRLAASGYAVRLAEFCPRRLTPRNLLLQAWVA
ncbi:MAG: methyltransferase [Rhodocyclaceae bacterium]|nr:methyltransferase [Rhodocyclaceae bacterium]